MPRSNTTVVVLVLLAMTTGCQDREAAPPVEAAPAVSGTPTTPAGKWDVGQPPPPPPRLRVVTYNILGGKRGIEPVAQTLLPLDADVIALQEVDRHTRRFGRIDVASELAQRLGMRAAFVRHRVFDQGEIGVALLSRLPIRDPHRLSTPDGVLGMLAATVDTAWGPVDVRVVHLVPTDRTQSAAARARTDRQRLAEARRVLASLPEDEGPVLVLGDCNAAPGTPTHAALSGALTDACAPEGSPTFPASGPATRIDYVWTSNHFAATDCRVGRSVASDHLPVVVQLQWRGSAQSR